MSWINDLLKGYPPPATFGIDALSGEALTNAAEFFFGIRRRDGQPDYDLRNACLGLLEGYRYHEEKAPAPKPVSKWAGKVCPCDKQPPRDGMPGCEYHHV